MTTDSLLAVHPTAADRAESAEQQRINAFLSPGAAEVFHPIVYQHEIWKHDVFDVESIHEEARSVFRRLLNRAAAPSGASAGRILLLLGESGSGKTHLMRAFRGYVHSGGLGYCGYLQMTSTTNNYSRYVLSKLVESLDLPYHEPNVTTSGLMRLSGALLDTLPMTTPEERAHLREGFLAPADLTRYVHQLADCALIDPRFSSIDVDVLRALLFLQRDEARIKNRVLKFLRCEYLSPPDQEVVGYIVPRVEEESPLQMLGWLGKVMWNAQSAPLVLCLDQLEDVVNQNTNDKEAQLRFRKVMDAACAIANEVPSSVIVIACLEDYYQEFRNYIAAPKLDRIEKDPAPVRLTGQRNDAEVQALIGRRMQHICDEQDTPFDEQAPTSPFSPAALRPVSNLRARQVLEFCHLHRENCLLAGGWVEPNAGGGGGKGGAGEGKVGGGQPRPVEIEQAWNDFRAEFKEAPSDDEDDLARLLAWAITKASDEILSNCWFAAEADGQKVPVEIHGPDNAVDRLFVAVCNKAAQGGGLMVQVKEVEKWAGENAPVLVRGPAFPSIKTTAIFKVLAQIVAKGGRKVIVEDSDWRIMLALKAFRAREKESPKLLAWLRESRPLTSLASLQAFLPLDRLLRSKPSENPAPQKDPAPKETPAEQPPAPAPAKEVPEPTGLLLGAGRDRAAAPLTLDPQDLKLHAAFLGGTGSGKTTLALNVIEQLLLRGVPAVLVDRKGDLCGYADPTAWERALSGPDDVARRQRLRERLDVHVFTPGRPDGRPLTIPVAPDEVSQLPAFEREQIAGYAAAALGGMMNYKSKGNDAKRLAILCKAIEILCAESGRTVTLPDLIQFVNDQDDQLVSAVGVLDVRQFNALAQDLQTLWLRRKDLLEGGAERLSVDLLLGLGNRAVAGKTRLSVISTRFLGDAAAVDFWVAQLLLETARWAGRKPSETLQAVLLFDEADLYLPAVRQPAAKGPMENLLRRARSAGVGLLLATQSPGDFDYKCRDNIGTWFVGKITQRTALDKMKPLLSDCKTDVAGKLPGQERGQFHLIRPPTVVGLSAKPSLIETKQLSEDRILALARARRPAKG